MNFIKFLLILIILVITTLGIGLFLVIDNEYVEPEYLSNSEVKELNISEILSYGLKDTVNTSNIEFTLSEKEINLIY